MSLVGMTSNLLSPKICARCIVCIVCTGHAHSACIQRTSKQRAPHARLPAAYWGVKHLVRSLMHQIGMGVGCMAVRVRQGGVHQCHLPIAQSPPAQVLLVLARLKPFVVLFVKSL